MLLLQFVSFPILTHILRYSKMTFIITYFHTISFKSRYYNFWISFWFSFFFFFNILIVNISIYLYIFCLSIYLVAQFRIIILIFFDIVSMKPIDSYFFMRIGSSFLFSCYRYNAKYLQFDWSKQRAYFWYF